MSRNPFPYFNFDTSPQNLQRLRDTFATSYDAVDLARLTVAGISVLENRIGTVPRQNTRFQLFENGWMLHVKNSTGSYWVNVHHAGAGGPFAKLVKGVVAADVLLDGAHPVGTIVDVTSVDDYVQPGQAQAAGLMHLDVHASDFIAPPVVVNYDVQDRRLPTIYMKGYMGPDDPFFPFLVENAERYNGPVSNVIQPLPDGTQKDYLQNNAHRLWKAPPYSIIRRHNCTPHAGSYLPLNVPPQRRRFLRVAVIRPAAAAR